MCENTATIPWKRSFGLLAAALTLLLFPARWLPEAQAQVVRSYVSSLAGHRLTALMPLRFETLRGHYFAIDEKVSYQKIDGFGASFLEAGMVCLNSLEASRQEGVMRALFDTERGAGFSAMKTVLGSNDFMSAGPFFTYNDTPGDVAMKNFSIARDLAPNGLVPYIRLARQHGSFVLQATMDYPPDWMLYDVNKNQDVNPKYYDALALYFLRYLQEYEKLGIDIKYLSLFNEPLGYTKIKYSGIRDLIKNHVGPLLEKENCKTKIQLSEAPGRVKAYEEYPTVLDDPEARKYVASIPYHGYGWVGFEKIAELHKRYPELPLWMTEICHGYLVRDPHSMPIPVYDFEDGDFWGHQIFSDLEAGASAWIYWNMILDQNGGPWLVSRIHADPDPNVQHPVVIIHRETKDVTLTGLYYYLAHFSKFVRPGAVRIEAMGSQKGVRCIAFRHPDGRLVVQLMNSSSYENTTRLRWRDKLLKVSLPAVSITTLVWAEEAEQR